VLTPCRPVDEAGLAVAEAAAIGLPIVCLDRGGPPVIAGGGVEPGTEAETVERLRDALERALDSNPPPARLDPATRRAELLGLLRSARLIPAEVAGEGEGDDPASPAEGEPASSGTRPDGSA